MKKYLALIAITLNVCIAQAGQKSNFNVELLSAKGRAAYQKLFAADVFRVGGVGFTGETSKEELALFDLLDEQHSVEALKNLVSDGTYEGGLYGLLGLSLKNVEEFNRAVEVYKSREQPPERKMSESFVGLYVPHGKVATQSGCILLREDWLRVAINIQSGHYDKILGKQRD